MKKAMMGILFCGTVLGATDLAHADSYRVVHNSCVKAVSSGVSPAIHSMSVLICGETETGNYRLRRWEPNCYSSPSCFFDAEGNGAQGVSISATGSWLLAKDGKTSSNETVWTKAFGAWQPWPKNLCDGGTIDIRTKVGDRTIAASTDHHVYAVQHRSGRDSTAWWNGSCWWPMPVTASGNVIEVGIFSDHNLSPDNRPWVLTDTQQMFYWNGTSWVSMLPGIAAGIGDNDIWLIGSDGATLWTFNHQTFTFSHYAEWTFGAVQMTNNGHVVAPDGTLWIRRT